MTPRERLLTVYRGGTPDCVPALADLSYWHAANGGGKFVPGKTNDANLGKVPQLMELHRRTGAAIHLNLGAFFSDSYGGDIRVKAGIEGEEYVHVFQTPVGSIREVREWSDTTYSWPITHHMVQSAEDLKVVRYVFEHVAYEPRWDVYHRVNDFIGDMGLPLACAPYTGMGFLMSRYAGVERTVLFAADEPDEFEATLAAINAAHERVFTLLAEGPAEVLFVSDNLSADVQSPRWFNRYSAPYYKRMADIAHAHGKPLVTHIDGRLRGLIRAVADTGVDASDAVTPAPWGDLAPHECRAEAGRKFVLAGGVPPDSFAPDVPLHTFDNQVEAWLALRHDSPGLVIAPGDQLPPGGDLDRVTRMVQAACAARF